MVRGNFYQSYSTSALAYDEQDDADDDDEDDNDQDDDDDDDDATDDDDFSCFFPIVQILTVLLSSQDLVCTSGYLQFSIIMND